MTSPEPHVRPDPPTDAGPAPWTGSGTAAAGGWSGTWTGTGGGWTDPAGMPAPGPATAPPRTPPPPADDPWARPWPAEAPPAPPYVDGPIRFPDTGELRPVRVPIGRPAPGPAPFEEPPSRRGRTVLAAVLAVVVLLGALGASRVLTTEPTQDTATPTVTAPPTTKVPRRTPGEPSTTTPRSSAPSTTTPRAPQGGTDDGSGSSGGGSGNGSGNGSSNGSGSGSGNGSGGTPSTTTPDLSDQVAAVTPGVVNITSLLPGGRGVGAGTGIVISATGDVVTNNHVVEGAESIQASISATGATYTATVVGADPTHDIAVIHLATATDLTPVPLGNSDDVRVGDAVAAAGNAGGAGGAPVVATGHVLALHEPVTAPDELTGVTRTLTDLIEVDANVQPGDSGGPLVSEQGEVIGIDVAASVSTSRSGGQPHLGFAIPINRAMTIADQLLANPTTPTDGSPAVGSGYLGVQATDAPGGGAAIGSVQPGSPAAEAGLQAGDTITAIDSTTIGSARELVTALAGRKGGEKAAITWRSADGSAHRATVTLAAR